MNASPVAQAQPTPISFDLQDRIRHARRTLGISRAELARRIGVGPSAAVQWEHNNGTSPRIRHLIAIARITGVSFEWLATGRGAARPEGAPNGGAPERDRFPDHYEEQILALARKVPSASRGRLLEYLLAACK